MQIRIYYEDTDAGGVVYHASFVRFFERARTEWLRSLGFEQDELKSRDGIVFAVRKITVDYLKPVYFNELLEISSYVAANSQSSMTFEQAAERRGADAQQVVVSRAETVVVCVDINMFRPTAIPQKIIGKI